MQSLKYATVTNITGWWLTEPDWVPVTFHGAPSSMYPTAWTVPCSGTVDPHKTLISPLQHDRAREWQGCEGRCAFDPGYCCNCHFCPKGCFPAASKVSLENGKSVTISELQIADKLKTGRALTVFFNI